LLVIIAIAVHTGNPPRRLSFGGFTFENETAKTAEVLSGSAEALEETQLRLDNLELRLDQTQAVIRNTARDLRDMAPNLPNDSGAALRAVANALLIQLKEVDDPRPHVALDEALDSFRSSLAGLQRLVQDD
jgi:hypothetical protein